jgi:hypothetical protein
MNCEIDELSQLGSGFPLYFYFTKYLIYIMLVFWMVAGFACLVGNLVANEGGSDNSFISKASTGNFGEDKKSVIYQHSLHLVAGLLFILFYAYFIRKMMELIVTIDVMTTTASDFTVWVKNLPANYDIEDLKNYFQTSGRLDNKFAEVVSVIPIYDLTKLLHIFRKLNQWRLVKEYLIKLKDSNPNAKLSYNVLCFKSKIYLESIGSIQEIENKIQKLEAKKELLLHARDKQQTTSYALITFRSQLDSKQIVEDWYITWLGRLLDKLSCGVFSSNKRYYHNNRLSVKPAPEPTDIYWENMNVSKYQKIKMKTITYTMMGLLLTLSFLVEYFLSDVQKSYSRLYSILVSISIVVINFLIGRVVRIFAM